MAPLLRSSCVLLICLAFATAQHCTGNFTGKDCIYPPPPPPPLSVMSPPPPPPPPPLPVMCPSPPPPIQPPPSPPTKTCNLGIGLCSFQCNDACCNAKCAQLYPGPLQGQGSCTSAGPPEFHGCLCTYKC